jgi:hypothetical protein
MRAKCLICGTALRLAPIQRTFSTPPVCKACGAPHLNHFLTCHRPPMPSISALKSLIYSAGKEAIVFGSLPPPPIWCLPPSFCSVLMLCFHGIFDNTLKYSFERILSFLQGQNFGCRFHVCQIGLTPRSLDRFPRESGNPRPIPLVHRLLRSDP